MKKIFTLFAAMVCAVCVNAQTTTTLWEGSTTFDESWSGSEKIGVINAKAGDKLLITAKPEAAVSWEWGSQVFVKTARAGWDAISSTINVTEEKVYEVEITDTEIEINEDGVEDKVKTTMLAELKDNGLVIQGIDATITKVELLSSAEYETEGKEIVYDEYGNILASEFEGFSDNDKVVFTYNITGELTSLNDKNELVSNVGWGAGSIKSLDGSVNVGDCPIKVLGDNEVSFAISDLKSALEAPKDQYDRQGLYWNVWDQGNAKVTRKSVKVYKVKSDPTGISDNIAAPKAENNVRYNLLGVKNGNGIYIMNGKKYMK